MGYEIPENHHSSNISGGPFVPLDIEAPDHVSTIKESNPKDGVGTRKWRQFTVVPFTVLWELGVVLLEGSRKYGRHNYRAIGVRSSVYVDAALGHIHQWWEGEDDDPDSGVCHITHAIASLTVLRDAMLNDKWSDDRPPPANIEKIRADLQKKVEAIIDRHPTPKPPYVRPREEELDDF